MTPLARCAHTLDMEATDPVGTVEIAERLGVTRSTVDKWRLRDLGFPSPRWTVGGRPAWDYTTDVLPWAKETGRLKETSK